MGAAQLQGGADTHSHWLDEIFKFDVLSKANQAAKDSLERMLNVSVSKISSLVHVADGNKTIAEYDIEPELYHKTPKEGSNGVLDEYTVPDSDLTATLSATSAKGKKVYTATLFLYCDPYGADLYNVVRTEITARVLTMEETDFNSEGPEARAAASVADPWEDGWSYTSLGCSVGLATK